MGRTPSEGVAVRKKLNVEEIEGIGKGGASTEGFVEGTCQSQDFILVLLSTCANYRTYRRSCLNQRTFSSGRANHRTYHRMAGNMASVP